MTLSRTGIDLVTAADARSRLLAELAGSPARRGFAIAYDLLGNRAEAEEAVQEALANACESIDDLRDSGAAGAWFLRVVTTTCLRVLRRRRLRRALFGWMASRDNDAGASPEDHAGVHGTAPPFGGAAGRALVPAVDALAARVHGSGELPADSALAAHEARTALLGWLGQLSPQQCTALVLRYGHDLPVAQVAELLGVELATAKTHLVRGLARLRDLMEEHR
jgi:RNA polymerase sigma-70 factor (ECF subfamily)